MRKYLIVFTLLFLALLAVDAVPALRGGAGWQWPYAPPESWPALIALALLLVVYVIGALLLTGRGKVWPVLAWAVTGGALLAVSVTAVRGDPAFLLFTRTVSPVQTGASTIAINYLAAEGVQPTLRRWPQVMAEARQTNLIHFSTSPPGQPLLHHAAARALDALPSSITRPASLALRPFQCSDANIMSYTRGEILSVGLVGMLMPLWAALAALPVYAAGRLLTDDPLAALRAAIWWPLVPSVLLFAPTWNTLYPLLGVTAFALLLAGLRREREPARAMRCLAAGVVMAAAALLNFAVLPLLLLLGLFTLGYQALTMGTRDLLGSVRVGLWFGLGLGSLWAVLWLAAGISPFDLLAVTFEQHGELVQRDYLPWLLLHPYDVLMFTGWPLAGLFFGGFWLALRRLRRGESLSAPGLLALALLLTFALVNLSGVVQGENARILSYYAPFFLLAGLPLLARSPRWDLPLLAVQALTVLVMAAVLPVVPLDLNPQPTAPRADVPVLDVGDPRPVSAEFHSDDYAGRFRLESHRFVADLGERVITLETIWRGLEPVERPYHFEVVAYAQNEVDGRIVTEPFRWRAQNGNYLPTCWRPGDEIRDVVLIPLPVVGAPVVWELELRAIDERSGDRMRVTLPDGTTTGSAPLGPVPYP